MADCSKCNQCRMAVARGLCPPLWPLPPRQQKNSIGVVGETAIEGRGCMLQPCVALIALTTIGHASRAIAFNVMISSSDVSLHSVVSMRNTVVALDSLVRIFMSNIEDDESFWSMPPPPPPYCSPVVLTQPRPGSR